MADTQLSIFQIPLIIDLICSHLDPSDCLQCFLVSKTWSQAFERHSWRRACLFPATAFQEREYRHGQSWLSQVQKEKILGHAHWIRSLETLLGRDTVFLKDFGGTRLQAPSIHGRYNGRMATEAKDLWVGEPDIYLGLMEEILEMNPRLAFLALEDLPDGQGQRRGHQGMMSLEKTLPTLSCLNSLILTHIAYDRCSAVLHGLQVCCPETLTDLKLAFQGEAIPDSVERYPFSGRHLPLTRFHLVHDLTGLDDLDQHDVMMQNTQSIYPFLKRCPLLVDISLPDFSGQSQGLALVLIEFCPRIKVMDLKCLDWSQETLDHLLDAFVGLKAFSFQYNHTRIHTGGPGDDGDWSDSVLRALWTRSVDTLEVLTVFCCQEFLGMVAYRILSHFPQLKDLTLLLEVDVNFERRYNVVAQPEWTLQELLDKEWSSPELESLKLPLFFPRRFLPEGFSPFSSKKALSSQETRLDSLTDQLVNRLVGLPKLKSIDLEWVWPEEHRPRPLEIKKTQRLRRKPKNRDVKDMKDDDIVQEEYVPPLSYYASRVLDRIRAGVAERVNVDVRKLKVQDWVCRDGYWIERTDDMSLFMGHVLEEKELHERDVEEDSWEWDVNPEDYGIRGKAQRRVW